MMNSSDADSESSDWSLDTYRAYNEDTATSLPLAEPSSGTTTSSGYRFREKRKAPTKDVMKDNLHGSSRVRKPLIVTRVEKKKSSFQTKAVCQLSGSLTKVEGLRFAIVVARSNEIVSKLLLEGALDTFKKYSVREEDIVVVWVPGSFEIGLVAEKLGKSGKYHAILCIGAVVKGDTTDYDVVANSVASGILSAGLNSGVPCIFGVLTCDDMDKALSHAGGKAGNKGSEAALTAIEMASLFEHHLKK